MVVKRYTIELDQEERLIGHKEIILALCMLVISLIYVLLATNKLLIFDNLGDAIAIGIMSIIPLSVCVYKMIMYLLGE